MDALTTLPFPMVVEVLGAVVLIVEIGVVPLVVVTSVGRIIVGTTLMLSKLFDVVVEDETSFFSYIINKQIIFLLAANA